MPGTMTVTLKNGSTSAKRDQHFSGWKAGESKLVLFKDIDWDPDEWTVQFTFEDTKATQTYLWKR
jgi:hypothetical protein